MSALFFSTLRYVHLAFSKGTAAGDSQRRYVRIVRGIFSGLASKGVAVLVGVPGSENQSVSSRN